MLLSNKRRRRRNKRTNSVSTKWWETYHRGVPHLGEVGPETHCKRQATQHVCLLSLLGAGGQRNGNSMYTVRKKIFFTGPNRAAKAEQKSLVPARQDQRTNQEGPLSFVLFESPFTSVSTINRVHPSLVSLDELWARLDEYKIAMGTTLDLTYSPSR